MCAVDAMLLTFFLTVPGMAAIVIVCIGNAIVFRARRAYSHAIGLTMLGVMLVPAAFLSILWSGATPMRPEERGDPLTRAIVAAVAVFLLIWVPVAIRCVVDERRPVEPPSDKPTGGFPVIGKEDRR